VLIGGFSRGRTDGGDVAARAGGVEVIEGDVRGTLLSRVSRLRR
jgi:hypothetical protein